MQLIEDWTTQPFIDIRLEPEAKGCPSGYESLINKVWDGTYDTC